jgi:hypothetical protein
MDFDTSEIDNLPKDELIDLFNESLYQLLKQLNSIIKDEDLSYCYSVYNDVTKMNRILIIDQFNINVLEFYDKIKEKDVNFFLDEKNTTKKFEGSSVVGKIFKFKSLFEQLSKKQKDMLFEYLNILCYIGARYFMLTN